ncbi:hypothetical protein Tco_0623243 [Tanacetum coccineum]
MRQAYLDGTDTESKPFEDPVEIETLESPLTIEPPTSLPESTSLTLVPILRRTARMAVRVPPAMSPGLSANMAEVAAILRDQRVSTSRQLTLTTWRDPEDGMVYIDVPTYPPPTPPAQTPSSPEWSSGSLPIYPSPSIVPSPISSPMIPLTVPSPVALPATAETEGFLTELGAQVEIHRGLIRDHARPVLAMESWAGQTDTQRAALWHAISDIQGENQELRLQLVEETRARLELVEVIDSMRRGQETKGDA